ncbi:hypothetical protein CAEBREN_10837 [Caenorhabditis brenneri]|uniref:T20D4.11-like domain-containing protein n=1 Tax=Caenorhabditis brenneri TaxID=135651 RepID=G0MA20_CAEBE|nr:hypothetical protein CAEBREN_10837 [Caenorhabditis brenneri]
MYPEDFRSESDTMYQGTHHFCLFFHDFQIQTLKHLTEITTTGKPDYKKVGPDVIKDCKSFEDCSPALKCLNDTTLEDVTEKLITNCEAAEYFITVFPECNEKLEALNSNCLQEWNPFPEVKSNATLVEKMDAEREACKNFYEKEECVKRTIVKTCGEDEWEKFNKHQKNVAKILGVCGEGSD